MWQTTVSCDRCGFREDVEISAFQYRFPDGSQSQCLTSLGWCDQCRTCRLIEQLPKLSTLEKKIARLRLGEASEYEQQWCRLIQADLQTFLADELSRIESLESWLQQRESPPRCLTCGSTEIRMLDDAFHPGRLILPHPNCGGRLDASSQEVSQSTPEVPLDPEGHRLD